MILLDPKIYDITGKVYNKLTVVEYVGRDKHSNQLWTCRCSCGNFTTIPKYTLTSQKTKSCGCLQKEVVAKIGRLNGSEYRLSLIGRTFGRLTVEQFCCRYKGSAVYTCFCTCGGIVDVRGYSLENGDTISCGCWLAEISLKSGTHRLKGHRLYSIRNNIMSRCYNPNTRSYKHYGLRGIDICDQWRYDFKAFYDWALANGYQDHLTIERIDNDLGYNPGNCRWVTQLEQARNKRSNVLTMDKARAIREEGGTFSEIAEYYGISETTARDVKNNKTWKEDIE